MKVRIQTDSPACAPYALLSDVHFSLFTLHIFSPACLAVSISVLVHMVMCSFVTLSGCSRLKILLYFTAIVCYIAVRASCIVQHSAVT